MFGANNHQNGNNGLRVVYSKIMSYITATLLTIFYSCVFFFEILQKIS